VAYNVGQDFILAKAGQRKLLTVNCEL